MQTLPRLWSGDHNAWQCAESAIQSGPSACCRQHVFVGLSSAQEGAVRSYGSSYSLLHEKRFGATKSFPTTYQRCCEFDVDVEEDEDDNEEDDDDDIGIIIGVGDDVDEEEEDDDDDDDDYDGN